MRAHTLAARGLTRGLVARATRGAASHARIAHTDQSASKRDDFSGDGPGDLYVPVSAMELIDRVPPTPVDGLWARCDGGDGPLGHPRVSIDLHKGVGTCLYCGVRFASRTEHHH